MNWCICTLIQTCIHILTDASRRENEIIQGDIELKASCNDSGSEAQSSLEWNPASLSQQVYCFGSYPLPNLNFEYHCYNISNSSDHQVNMHIHTHLLKEHINHC